MAAVQPSQSFTFVTADSAGKLNETERKLVRSHCMRGKNTKVDSRRHRAKIASTLRRLQNLDATGNDYNPRESAELQVAEAHLRLAAPPKDLSLIKFAGKVDETALALLHKCKLSHYFLGALPCDD